MKFFFGDKAFIDISQLLSYKTRTKTENKYRNINNKKAGKEQGCRDA